MEEQKLAVINFGEVEIKNLDGETLKVDKMGRTLGSGIWLSAPTLEVDVFAREIHAKDRAEVDKDTLAIIINMISQRQFFGYSIQSELIKYLKRKHDEL